MSSNDNLYETTGLMPQIQALIAPPISDATSTSSSSSSSSKTKNKHPYFKRHGRGHNHDLCDACSEGGDLICCDKCPSSFHLQCHDPPLDETNIPMGEWMCNQCRSKKRRLSTSSGGQQQKSGEESEEKKSSMMDMLIDAAKVLNPQKFDLPVQMQAHVDFPGMDKDSGKKQGSDQSDSIGDSKCYMCSKTGRQGVLAACDYCPSYFHLDCLDPPLTMPPSDKWMCPNHVQHILDSKLLTSVSLSERTKLWDEFAHNCVDQDAVKVEFFRKVHRRNPPFRYKVKMAPRKRANIPGMVKAHYRAPVQLLPSLKHLLRVHSALSERSHAFNYDRSEESRPDDVKPETLDFDDDNENIEMVEEQGEEEEKVEVKFDIDSLERSKKAFVLSAECEQFLEQVFQAHRERCAKISKSEPRKQTQEDVDKEKAQNNAEAHQWQQRSLLKQLDENLVTLLAFQRVQQLLAVVGGDFGRMPLPSQLLTQEDIERITQIFSSPGQKRGSVMPTTQQVAPKASPSSDTSVVGNIPLNVQNGCLRARAMLCPVVSKYFYNVRNSDGTEVRHDASFMGYRPTVSNRFPEAHSMRYRSLSIGKGSANSLQLDLYGTCSNISPKHAVIFYDEFTKHYELLNYSMHGTFVNNVLYTNQVSDRPPPPSAIRSVDLDKQVKEIVDKRRKIMKRCKTFSLDSAKMIATEAVGGGVIKECSCSSSTSSTNNNINNPLSMMASSQSASLSAQNVCGAGGVLLKSLTAEEQQQMLLNQGWEGSALLHHGSLLRFGCISFVFSIVDCSTVS